MRATRAGMSRPSPASTVAVVDDDPAVRRAISRMLRAAGLRVASFSSAEELLQAYEEVHPACLVLDVVLPGMSGPDLVEKLRAAQRTAVPIFVTGRIDAQQFLRRRGLDKVPCLQKPFEPALLLEAVTRALEGAPVRPG
jgi:FixJ family two-component response regulator